MRGAADLDEVIADARMGARNPTHAFGGGNLEPSKHQLLCRCGVLALWPRGYPGHGPGPPGPDFPGSFEPRGGTVHNRLSLKTATEHAIESGNSACNRTFWCM